MSSISSQSTSRSNLDSIFNSALQAYKSKTGKDITSHPLATELQSCDSPDAILAVLRRQLPSLDRSTNSDERIAKCLVPIVNVLYAFSATLGGGVGLVINTILPLRRLCALTTVCKVFSPANVIFSGIGVLLLAAKDVNSSQDTLIGLFSRINYFFRRLEIYTSVPPTAAMTDISVDIMIEVLAIIGMMTKEVKRGRMKKYFKKLMGNTEMEDNLHRLDRLTQEEARMASAEQLKIAHSIEAKVMGVDERVQDVGVDVRKKVEGVDDRVQGINDKLDDTNRNLLRDNLLRWLSPSDPSTNHNIATKTHHDGTSQWFFQGRIFTQWKSTGSFLWVHGKPGSGKSVLCSSIVQDIMALHNAGRALMVYFYFDFRDVDKQKLENVLPSLLIQLSAQSGPCCDILSRLYSAHDRGVRKPNDRAQIGCLKEMLTDDAQCPTYIIMDAIDECPLTSSVPSPREEVLDFVDELVGIHLPNVHICVTSRPELDIRAFLEPLTPHPISLHDQSGQMEDIAEYVSSFVRSDRRMRRWRDEDKDLVIKTLPEKADGMFRWVFCQLEVLRHCFPPSVRRILEELPESLDETYERILREIKKSNKAHARRILQCLVAAVRPLRVEELAEILAFDFGAEGIPKLNPDWRWEDQEEAVMSTCSSLVIVFKDGDSRVVQFSHFSVKEFLMSTRLVESTRDASYYHIPLKLAHTILAQACLGVLLRLDDRIDRDKIKTFPLAKYAAEHWVEHVRFENVSSYVKDGMECLFDADKPHHASWLWVYNQDRYYDRSMRTMVPEKPEAVPLYYAALFGFHDLTAQLLAEHPEDIHAKGGSEVTPLHASARRGHVDILLLLAEHLPNLDIKGPGDQTPLHLVSEEGHLMLGQWLLDRGSDINARALSGWTPLYLAAARGQLDLVRMLLGRGASINASNINGWTPLHIASVNRHVEIVRLLLDYGADPNLCNNDGRTPSDEAMEYEWLEIVQLLSEHGTKPLKQ